MVNFEEFEKNVATIQGRVSQACQQAGRAQGSVSILPVTKTHPAEAVSFAADLAYKSVGENRVQEVLEKQSTGEARGVGFELIGHLQSNKAKQAVETCERIQSVDSEKLMRRIDRLAGEIGKTQRILVQVNAGEDPAKFGIRCEELEAFLKVGVSLENIKIEGLMTIAPLDDDPEVARMTFRRLREIRDAMEAELGLALPELSMGMTGDLEIAIAEGSTQIRVGSALYGARNYG
ncbi:MAG: YggS family pyridoxal phosphate-dependent enzyme [Opitutales bacterium]